MGKPLGPGHIRIKYQPIKLEALNGCAEGSTVTFESLFEAKAVQKSKVPNVKIVGGGELTAKNLVVHANAFTATAREAIEAAGGSCVILSMNTGLPVEASVVSE